MKSVEILRNWVGDAKNLSRREIQMVLRFQREKLKEPTPKQIHAALVAQRIATLGPRMPKAAPPPPPKPSAGYYIKLRGGGVDWVPIQRKAIQAASPEGKDVCEAKPTSVPQSLEMVPRGESKCVERTPTQLVEYNDSAHSFLRRAA